MNEFHLRLPATSANLGPGFDALALALKLYLYVDAEPASWMTVEATGRSADICGATENNLLIETYREILAAHGRELIPLQLNVQNEIPLGMGCGSSAAVRLAALALASHFGDLDWSRDRILAEAARLEGHPDNAAACWLGGLVASAVEGDRVRAISIAPPALWRAVIVMPDQPMATSASRGMLPESYTRKDVVANLQRVALLTAAFAAEDADVMATAMADRLHQPFRADACPLLPRLLPLAGNDGIAGVALSGAGPAVLLLTVSEEAALVARNLAARRLDGLGKVEFLTCELENTL
ncbi:MAG: homoserine kinase [Acidobacteriaceae bacterium]